MFYEKTRNPTDQLETLVWVSDIFFMLKCMVLFFDGFKSNNQCIAELHDAREDIISIHLTLQ